jgi:hypothetical protein
MAVETFGYRDKIPQGLNTQFRLIRIQNTLFRHGNRNKQTGAVMMFYLIGRREITTAMSRATNHAEGSPIEWVARIQNLDHRRRRFVSLFRRDIPEGLRSKGSIGGWPAASITQIGPDDRTIFTQI